MCSSKYEETHYLFYPEVSFCSAFSYWPLTPVEAARTCQGQVLCQTVTLEGDKLQVSHRDSAQYWLMQKVYLESILVDYAVETNILA